MTSTAQETGSTASPVEDSVNAFEGSISGARIGVVTFPGTLDDRDAARAVALAGGTAVSLWHGDESLKDVDAVVLPGGFSYGDYLRAGAISRFAPLMDEIIDAAKAPSAPLPVLGICNGFQVLTEAHLLPGSMIKNENLHFMCRDQRLRVENASTSWTNQFSDGQEIVIPLKNQDGQFIADEHVLDELEGEGRVVFRYAGGNPNGSRRGIAGISNAEGNVVGLMPHPEHAVEAGFGPDSSGSDKRFGDTPLASGTDGLGLFTSVLHSLVTR
ncbi:phosphoribosylformylglycinamidine synthase subunit PurQ [Arthrobacter monumenti]